MVSVRENIGTHSETSLQSITVANVVEGNGDRNRLPIRDELSHADILRREKQRPCADSGLILNLHERYKNKQKDTICSRKCRFKVRELILLRRVTPARRRAERPGSRADALLKQRLIIDGTRRTRQMNDKQSW